MRFLSGGLRVVLAIVVAVILVVGAALAAPSVLQWLRPVDHEVADTAVDGLEAPESVSEVAWEWRPPEGETIWEALPVESGVAVVLSDGVMGIHGESGAELWHYRRSDSLVRSYAATPDGRSVALTFSSESTESGEGFETTVVLDGGDGSLRYEYEVPALDDGTDAGDRSRFRNITNDSYAVPGRSETAGHLGVDSLSLRDGGTAWSYEEDHGIGRQGPVLAAEDVVVATGMVDGESGRGADAAGRLVVVGLDAATGELLWEAERPSLFEEEEFPEARFEPGWGAIALDLRDPEGEVVSWLVDPATGATLVETDSFPTWITGDGYVTRDLDPEGGKVRYSHIAFDGSRTRETSGPARAGEADIAAGIATSQGFLRLDYLEEESLLRGPVTLEALEWGGEGVRHSVPLGFRTHESVPAEVAAVMDSVSTPKMILVPGALVAVDQEGGGAGHVVGVS